MSYDQDILRILTEAGDKGLSVSKITRHVFNSCNTLFARVDYDEVHRYVSQYLLKNSKFSDSILEKTERGVYRMNPQSAESLQFMLQFKEEDSEPESTNQSDDLSLSLF